MTPMALPQSTIPIVGITDSSMLVVASSSSEVTTSASEEIQEIPPKCHLISPTLIPQPEVTSMPSSPPHPGTSDKSTTLLIVIVPKLAVPPPEASSFCRGAVNLFGWSPLCFRYICGLLRLFQVTVMMLVLRIVQFY